MKKIEVKKVKAAEVKENEWFCLVDNGQQKTVFKRLPGEEVIKGKEYIPVKFIKPQLTPETKESYIPSDAEVLGFKEKPLELLTLLSLY